MVLVDTEVGLNAHQFLAVNLMHNLTNMAKKRNIHSSIKKTLGFDENMPDKEFKKAWKRKSSSVCKPCWELKYCPYGPFVEQSPLLPSLKNEAIEKNERA